MLKRAMDMGLSAFGLVATSPILLPVMALIYRQDGHSPFYVAPRVGKNGKPFRMVKLRSMVIHADKSGVDSTGENDNRITPLGRFVRRYKLDELPQLWNVFKGDMSLVGPRPNVERDVALYSETERELLSVRPGITDFSSIVFSDEGEILKDSEDPDLDYNQRIRPWKSRLGLAYVRHHNVVMDLQLIVLTVVAILSKPLALRGVQRLLQGLPIEDRVRVVALRMNPLKAFPPPGMDQIVLSRT